MRKTGTLHLCALAMTLSGVASAQTTLSTINDPRVGTVEVGTGTIQATGLSTSSFLNVFGNTPPTGQKSSYGLLRFDLTRVRNQFNTTFGANKWRVTDANLELTQSNLANVTLDGLLQFYFTPEDDKSINATTTPYKYPTPAPAGKVLIRPYDFLSITPNGFVDKIGLLGTDPVTFENINSTGAKALGIDIQNDNLLTLTMDPGDDTVAATYRGQLAAFSVLAPQLVVTAEKNDGTTPNTLATISDVVGGTEVVTGTIQPAGPRTGTNGSRFMNIEGSSFGVNSSYGIARFNMTRIRSAFDTTYGAGNWRVRNVEIRLAQDNSAFTTNGPLTFAFTPEDTNDIKTAASTYKFPTPAPPSQQDITTFNFVRQDASTDVITLYGPSLTNAGATAVADDIRTDGTLTLVVNPASATTAATYHGQQPTVQNPPLLTPKLNITAVAASVVQGTLTWENLGAPQTVTFTLKPTTGDTIVVPVKVGSDGAYAVAGVPFGTYTVTIEVPTYLKKVVAGVNTASGSATLNTTLIGGDSNGDNGVDVLDLADLITSFDKCVGDAGFLPLADFNNDTCIDVLDLDVLIRGFDASGD